MGEKASMISGMWNVHETEKRVAQSMVREAKERPDELLGLVDETKVARKALEEAITGVGDAMETFRPASEAYMREIRAFKIASAAELANGVKAFEDIRKFFLSNTHEEEIRRLKEFIELLERLKALKESGLLDAVADTMLKL
jgi:hypothetical protein